MNRFLALVLALICASSIADTTADSPVPAQCTWARTTGTPATIPGGTAAQCQAAAVADSNAMAIPGTASYVIDGTYTVNLTYTAAPPPPPGSYSTAFSIVEIPVSEGGNWVNGKSTGLVFNNMAVVNSGRLIGLQPGNAGGNAKYADATALLIGTWPNNQGVSATVFIDSPATGTNTFKELEIRLRSTMTANNSSGYECLFSARTDSSAYVQIVRWNGALGSFTLIDARGGSTYAIHTGDTIKCTAIGSKITAYINGVQKLQVTDTVFSSGQPGLGAFLQDSTNHAVYPSASAWNFGYGFTSFTAGVAP